MSQEIQLSLTPSGTTLPQQPPSWSGPNAAALAPAGSAPATPLGKVHEALRGRYLVTFMMAAVFGLIGGALGAFVFHPGYQSVGTIEIDPVIQSPELADKIMPLYQAYIATTVNNLHSERVIREAMNSPDWKAHRPLRAEAYLASWQKDLVVKSVPGSFNISVTYTDDRKDGKDVAPIAVRSLIKAYQNLYGEEDKRQFDEKISANQRKSEALDQKIKSESATIAGFLNNSGENLQFIFDEKMRAHVAATERLKEIREDLRQKQEALKQAVGESATTPPGIEDLARVDKVMESYHTTYVAEELEVRKLVERLGKANPAAVAAQQSLDIRKASIEAYRDDLNQRFFIKERPDGTGGVLIKKDLSLEESAVKRTEEVLRTDQLELDDLGHRTTEISKHKTVRTRLEEEFARLTKKVDELTSERDMAKTFQVIDYGGQASIGTDKRIAFGALGFMAGGGFPVALMLLLSLMNPRFRFSDEATQHSTSGGLTLLGILPDLPDRLSDPEQASIAAHCVHQIRTMLQINTTGTDERRVFAITSAAPADGKTSLTLALGLSYAACGTRTLLIDCDLVGCGLTSRMNVASEDGVLEAIAHRTLLEYVRSTDIADVSILPVGSNQHLHASTLSPAALRRLIEEAKKHFDTILIDTGPVLGSIEASLVAAAADAVVLTVSRGQQRPLVEKTVQHLRNIKANLAGLVFNRAQTADFDRSISGISLRSAAAGSAHNAPRMGPVARAVQSAFKPAGDDDSN